jgi:hypothetical protein
MSSISALLTPRAVPAARRRARVDDRTRDARASGTRDAATSRPRASNDDDDDDDDDDDIDVALRAAASSSNWTSTRPSRRPRRHRIPRRDALAAAAAASVALASTPSAASAAGTMDPISTLTRRGMAKFARDDVEGSVADFDQVIALDGRRAPYMWQRGLSLYYLDDFDAGAAQFRRDVAVNPNDTEEAIWAFLCEVRSIHWFPYDHVGVVNADP